MSSNYNLLIGVVVIAVIIILVIKFTSNKDAPSAPTPTEPVYSPNVWNGAPEDPNATPGTENKEGFLLTSQNAYVSPITGAIKGPGIMTDGMTRMNLDDITKRVNSNGFVSDGAISLGVGSGYGFDKVYDSQLEIQRIDDKNVGGYQSIDDLDQISRKIASNNNNASNNMYTRAGSKPTKMIIEPNGIRGVIDEKYLPDRDKNHQIATVQTVVPVQGYDVNIERIGEYLTDTHFSKVSRNAKIKRIPTAAGAVGGGSKMNGSLEDNTVDSSANKDAIDQSISVDGNNIAIKDSVSGDTVLAPLDPATTESFRQTYVRGNHK